MEQAIKPLPNNDSCVHLLMDDLHLSVAISEHLSELAIAHKNFMEAHELMEALEASAPCVVVLDSIFQNDPTRQIVSQLQTINHDVTLIILNKKRTNVSLNRETQSDEVFQNVHVCADLDSVLATIKGVFSYGHAPLFMDRKSQETLQYVHRVANTPVNVLIAGESGTGKEVLARLIHQASDRANKPFVAINCAAIPESMLESILFGHEKGAFTGALKSQPGKFEQAQKGTILLDEISEMPVLLQAKLLRVLQEREVERIGGSQAISLDVRVIATTNKDLKEEVRENRFREDLYFRLNVFPIISYPLRDRKEDIIPLANFFIKKYMSLSSVKKIELTDCAKKKFVHHDWPGNVRELENTIQRAIIMSDNGMINNSDVVLDLEQSIENTNKKVVIKIDAEQENNKLNEMLSNQEYKMIISELDKHNGSRKNTSRALGISERTLRYKLAKMRDLGWAV